LRYSTPVEFHANASYILRNGHVVLDYKWAHRIVVDWE
jgi:hypothetical protein